MTCLPRIMDLVHCSQNWCFGTHYRWGFLDHLFNVGAQLGKHILGPRYHEAQASPGCVPSAGCKALEVLVPCGSKATDFWKLFGDGLWPTYTNPLYKIFQKANRLGLHRGVGRGYGRVLTMAIVFANRFQRTHYFYKGSHQWHWLNQCIRGNTQY